MNLRKLPPEKRVRLITVSVSVVLIAAGLGFGLIGYQYRCLNRLTQERLSVEAKLKLVQNAVQHADQIETDLTANGKKLQELEADVASGDLYSWAVNLIRSFKAGYKVEIPQVSPTGSLTEVDLLPSFPYKQAKFALTGTAHYHDLGHFLADFENQFPHLRVLNLSLQANISASPDEQETVSFIMVVAALAKPSGA